MLCGWRRRGLYLVGVLVDFQETRSAGMLPRGHLDLDAVQQGALPGRFEIVASGCFALPAPLPPAQLRRCSLDLEGAPALVVLARTQGAQSYQERAVSLLQSLEQALVGRRVGEAGPADQTQNC